MQDCIALGLIKTLFFLVYVYYYTTVVKHLWDLADHPLNWENLSHFLLTSLVLKNFNLRMEAGKSMGANSQLWLCFIVGCVMIPQDFTL